MNSEPTTQRTASNLSNEKTDDRNLSIGDSIALVGVWLIAAVLIAFLMLLIFTDLFHTIHIPVSQDKTEVSKELDRIFTLVIAFSPGIFAGWVTKHILFRKD